MTCTFPNCDCKRGPVFRCPLYSGRHYTEAEMQAALDAYRNNLLAEVIELAERHAQDFVPFVEQMKGNTPC